MKCEHCESESYVKNGLNYNSKTQRYKCKLCGKNFTAQPKIHGYSVETKQSAIAMYVDGQNYRRVARNLDVSPQSVANWVNSTADTLKNQPLPLPEVTPDSDPISELDELFTFQKKKRKSLYCDSY